MRDFHRPGRSLLYALNGVCATSHPLAAESGVRMLRDGGNAADAALAAAAALTFCEPHMTGLGGDCFILLKPAGEERAVGINASGRAPQELDVAALRGGGAAIAPRSTDAVTLPGAVAGFELLARDWGRLGLSACLQPAIQLAVEGAPVAPRVAHDWAREGRHLTGEARRWFLPWGRPPRPGDVFQAPGQAEALRRIAEQGARGFYEGEVAEDMAASLRALGGAHRIEDFAAVAADYVEPVSATYRDVDLIELPPNGQGATALLIAAILQRFDMTRLDPFGPMRAHLEAEACKLAYDARDRFLADPDAMPDGLAPMLASDKVEALAALIDPQHALPDARRATAAAHRDTVLVTAADRDGMIVSLIYSTFWGFGSGLASTKFGISFQNRGAGFSLTRGHPNEVAPGKRPLHTIIPALIARNGRIEAGFGVMGGQYQPAGHYRVLSNMVDFGLDPQSALDAPRSFFEDGAIRLERGYDESVIAPLESKGHVVTRRDEPLGGGQYVGLDSARGVLIGASDPRKDGVAHGW